MKKPRNSRPLTEKQQYWLAHIRACERTDQGLSEYARQEGLDARVLYSWKSRLRRLGVLAGKGASSFARVVPATSREVPQVRVHLSNGVDVELASVPPRDELKALIEVLGEWR